MAIIDAAVVPGKLEPLAGHPAGAGALAPGAAGPRLAGGGLGGRVCPDSRSSDRYLPAGPD
jgi:hypothetical protein